MISLADEAVASTNDDASICKYQAVLKGYYLDPFLEKFLSSKAKTTMVRKAPEINRGYYARSVAIAFLVEKFIEANPCGQIISLGAGYDTLYWRLNSKNLIKNEFEGTNVKYVEIDMSPVVVHKIMSIRRQPVLSAAIESLTHKGEGLHSPNYNLISFDLRQVDKTLLKLKLFNDCKLDPRKPTLCLAECVLVYMPYQDSAALIKWLSDSFSNLSMVNYEQCNMHDRFGDIMLANMNARHCDLMGVDACQSLDSQKERFQSNGLGHTKAWTLTDILNKCLLPGDVERIKNIEYLDEGELLLQLLDHYCIVMGSQKDIDWVPETQYWLSVTTLKK